LSPLALVGIAALAVVALGWIAVSFSAASRRRTRIEWIAASALYVVLLTIFARGFLWARGSDSTAGVIGFGFLCLFFGAGLVLSVVMTVRSRRGEKAPSPSATN
jgi:hypothetical protein